MIKKVDVGNLSNDFANNIVSNIPANKKGYTKLYKNQLQDMMKTAVLVGELEILELIALKYKATKEHEIDELIEFIDYNIEYDIKKSNATKIKKSLFLNIAKNSYNKGLKNAAKLMTNSIMGCSNYEEVIGDIHIRIQDIWNNKLKHNQMYRRISVEEYI